MIWEEISIFCLKSFAIHLKVRISDFDGLVIGASWTGTWCALMWLPTWRKLAELLGHLQSHFLKEMLGVLNRLMICEHADRSVNLDQIELTIL